MDKIVFERDELELFERIMKYEAGVRNVGLCTDSQKAELPILRSLMTKLCKTIALAREHGLVETPKKTDSSKP